MKPGNPDNVIDLHRARAGERPEEREGRNLPRVQSPHTPAPPGLQRRTRPRRIIAVGGGKGGIGKTMVSANLGIALAQAGQRVLLVDADLGGANLHTALGVSPPQLTLSDFVGRHTDKIDDVVVATPVPNLRLIAGASDVLDAANPRYQQKVKLLRNLQGVDADYLVLDLGAGTAFNTLDFFLIADTGILVLLPEPTSVENAYRFVKAAFFRKLQYLEDQYGIAALVEDMLSTREGAVRTPFEFVSRVKAQDPGVGESLERELKDFRVHLVVNQARTAADLNVGQAVVSAWKKFFGLEMSVLGAIKYDDEAWKAVRRRRPVLLERADCDAAQGMVKIAERLLSLDGRLAVPLAPGSP
ncbi:MAG TPA: P-loop NTPase [Myxococcaceae bacterium]|nr:P-loop NTPase [Myxococcaceae bacterium]